MPWVAKIASATLAHTPALLLVESLPDSRMARDSESTSLASWIMGSSQVATAAAALVGQLPAHLDIVEFAYPARVQRPALGALSVEHFLHERVITSAKFHHQPQQVGQLGLLQVLVHRGRRKQLLQERLGAESRNSRSRSALGFLSSTAMRTSV